MLQIEDFCGSARLSFSTGRTIDVEGTIIGISATSDFVTDDPWLCSVAIGSDNGDRYIAEGDIMDARFNYTDIEKRELADYMIMKWTQFRETLTT